MTIQTFTQAAEYLRNGRNPVERPLAHRTRIRWVDDETIAIRYQSTDVVTFHASGAITLSANGWYTLTTRSRIQEFSPFFLGRDSGGLWTVRYWVSDEESPREFPFADGMTLTPSGEGWTATGIPTPEELRLTHQWNATVRREVRLAVRKWTSTQGASDPSRTLEGWMSDPDDDCQECGLLAEGYVMPDNGHLWLHVMSIRRGLTNTFPRSTQRAAVFASGWVSERNGSYMARFLRGRLLTGPISTQGRTRIPSTEPITYWRN